MHHRLLSDPKADTQIADTHVDDGSHSTTRTRIRPSRPAMSQRPDDYPELPVIDPAHYTITGEIGAGGMGRIQIARDRRLGREIAIKEILVDRGVARRRFEREARITARLQHPSIVGVYEAGVWPTGEPFYAMPLLSGRSLDDAIAAAKTLEARLALLPNVLAIADATAYAHGKRVIHRDLKPRNVIVGEFGETVVIDWGIAKELDAPASASLDGLPRDEDPPAGGSTGGSSTETSEGDVLGTPAYMPPEQAAGGHVDERADVYAIGAILYHLLAGGAPFSTEGSTPVLVALVTRAPRPVEELAPQAPRELVAIVARAMARDRDARYPTARELAEDLRRFQTGQLVAAHRYSRAQRLRRWLRKHRTAVAATVAALVAATVIGVVSLTRILHAYDLAEEQRALAITNQHRAEELLHFLLVELREKLAPVGKLELLDSVARRAIEHYDGRGTITSDEDRFLVSLAREVLGAVLFARKDLPAARTEYEQARAGFDELARRSPLVKYHTHRAGTDFALAGIQNLQGDVAGALAKTQAALAQLEALDAVLRADVEVSDTIQRGHKVVAELREDLGEPEQALAAYRTLVTNYEADVLRAGTPTQKRRMLAVRSSIGRILEVSRGDLAGALVEYRAGLAIGEVLLALEPGSPSRKSDVAISRTQVSRILLAQKDLTGARTEIQAALALLDAAVAADPANYDTRDSLGSTYEKLGMVELAREDYPAALAAFRKFHELAVLVAARDPSNGDQQRSVSLALNKIGDVQLATDDGAGALTSFQAALAIREALVAKDPSNAPWRRDRFYSLYEITQAHMSLGHEQEALKSMRAALAVAEDNLARIPANPSFQSDVAEAHQTIAMILLASKDREGARAEYRRAIDVAKEFARTSNSAQWAARIAKYEKRLAEIR